MQEDRSDTLGERKAARASTLPVHRRCDDQLVHIDNYEDKISDLIDEDEIMNYLESNAPTVDKNEDSIEKRVETAIEIYRKIKNLNVELDEHKEFFREYAKGEKFEVLIKQLGKLTVSKPTTIAEKKVITVDLKKLEQSPELKAKLLASGLLKEEVKSASTTAAAVRISLL